MKIYNDIVDNLFVAILVLDDKGQITLANKYAGNLFRYNPEEILGKKIELLVPDVTSEYLQDTKNHAPVIDRKKTEIERGFIGVRKDQSQFHAEVALNPLSKDGNDQLICAVFDITERRRAEDQFRAAFDAAPNGMLMIDSRRRIVLINKKIEEIFGYTREELIGETLEVLVPNDFKGPHPKFVESYVRNPTPRAMGIGRELFGRHKSGKLVPVEIGLQPISTKGETFVISSVVDITYRKNTENEIKRKTEEIEEFSYRTSHDLRSPLKSISAMAECLFENMEEHDYATATVNIGKIKNLSERLMTLVEDILTLTKVEISNEGSETFNFEEYIKDFSEKFSAAIDESGVTLQSSFLHRRPLNVQPTRLSQILDNLISNAVKYSDKTKDNRFVRLSTFSDANRFFIHVEDNGLGIPKERQSEVFGMFKRFHAATIPGSGLGLYLVKKQISKIGAEIGFESNKDGTAFYIEFKNQA